MLWVLKRTVSVTWVFEHPRKYLQLCAETFCLSKPVDLVPFHCILAFISVSLFACVLLFLPYGAMDWPLICVCKIFGSDSLAFCGSTVAQWKSA